MPTPLEILNSFDASPPPVSKTTPLELLNSLEVPTSPVEAPITKVTPLDLFNSLEEPLPPGVPTVEEETLVQQDNPFAVVNKAVETISPKGEKKDFELGGQLLSGAAQTGRGFVKGLTLQHVDIENLMPGVKILRERYIDRGVRIDPEDPWYKRLLSSLERDPSLVAEIPAEILGSVAPISRISKAATPISEAVSGGLSKALPGGERIAQFIGTLSQAGVTGGTVGLAQALPPGEGDGLGRFEEAAKTAGAFMAFAGAATLVDTGIRAFQQKFGRIPLFNELRRSIIDTFTENGVPERDATGLADKVLASEIQAAGGWKKVTRKALRAAGERIKTFGRKVTTAGKKEAVRPVVPLSDPAIEADFSAARVQPIPTFLERVKDKAAETLKVATRQFPELPNQPFYAPIKQMLNKQNISKKIAQFDAIQNIRKIVQVFNPQEFDTFSRKVIIDDLVEEAKSGRKVPFYTRENPDTGELETNTEALLLDQARLNLVTKAPKFVQSSALRQETWDDITGRLVKLKILKPEQLKKNYFRHRVLDHAIERATTGTGKKLKTPESGFTQRRKGTEKAIHTDYLAAEFEVMSQALHDIRTAENLLEIENSEYNIRKSVNETHIKNLENAVLEAGGVTQELAEFRQGIPEGFLDEMIDDPDALSGTAPYEIKLKNQLRKLTGKEDLGPLDDWRNSIPEGYTTWQPKEGRIFFNAQSIPEKIAEQIIKEGSGEVLGDMVKPVLAAGQLRKELVLPEEIAAQLNNLFIDKQTGLGREALVGATRSWKEWVLFWPKRAIRYNWQNFIGDTDALIAGNPAAFKKVGRAFSELYDVFKNGTTMSADMREFYERGGLDAGLTIQELPDLQRTKEFEGLYKQLLGKPFAAKTLFRKGWEKIKDLSTFRENIYRYAAYLDYKEKFVSGVNINYGASIRGDVDALTDPLDKAAKVATELLGDYSTITALGKEARELVAPFYSWVEVNFKRYPRLTVNAFKDGLAQGGKTGAAIAVAKLVTRMSLLTTAMILWNQTFFSEEEEELSPFDRNRMHINLGKHDGKTYILRGQGAFSDFLEYFGLNEFPQLMRQYAEGKISMKEILTLKTGLVPFAQKAVNTINPFFKLMMETLTGKTVPYEEFRSFPIRDRVENLMRPFQLVPEFRALTGKPSRPYATQIPEFFGIIIRDPEANAYSYIQNLKRQFLESKGKGGSGDFYSPGSSIYRDYRLALRFKDKEAENRALDQMKELGATPKDLQRVLIVMHPLKQLSKVERAEFLTKYLSEADKDQLKKAMTFFQKTFAGENLQRLGRALSER